MGWLSSFLPGLLLACLPVFAQDFRWLTRQVSLLLSELHQFLLAAKLAVPRRYFPTESEFALPPVADPPRVVGGEKSRPGSTEMVGFGVRQLVKVVLWAMTGTQASVFRSRPEVCGRVRRSRTREGR